MRWLAFAVVAVAAIVVQTAVAPHFTVGGARPDFILLATVFFALHVRSIDVIMAGWMLGLLADLQSTERFGLCSLVYASAAAVVYLVREHLFRAHPLSQFAITLVVGLLIQVELALYYQVAGHGAITPMFTQGCLSAVYTAVLAPPTHYLLLQLTPWLGLHIPRYTHAGLSRHTF